MTVELATKSVVVIGVSHDPAKYGNKIFTDMVQAGWKVAGVNPKGGMVAERNLYQSLQAVPDPVDAVVTVVAPAQTEAIIDQAQKRGIRVIWMQPGSESAAAIERATEAGMEVVHDSCIMIKAGLW